MKNFTNLYSTSKTLRFRLKPVGETLSTFDKNEILIEDNGRKEAYAKVKLIIDEYHREFIKKALQDFRFNESVLKDYCALFSIGKKSVEQEDAFKIVQDQLRKDVAKEFKIQPVFKDLFGKEVFNHLIEFCQDFYAEKPEELESAISSLKYFEKFSTYFKGFSDNRKNMYTDEAKRTRIAYRIVHDNLPLFLRNQKVFEHFKSQAFDVLSSFETDDFAKILKRLNYDSTTTVDAFFNLDWINKIVTQNGIDVYNTVLGGHKDSEKSQSIKGLNQKINEYKPKDSKEKIGQLSRLKKQILSDIVSASISPEPFKNDKEVLEAIKNFYAHTKDAYSMLDTQIKTVTISDSIYINTKDLSTISQSLLGGWNEIKLCFWKFYQDHDPKPKKNSEQYDKLIEKEWNRNKSISLSELNLWIQHSYPEKNILSYFKQKLNELNFIQTLEQFYREYINYAEKLPENELKKDREAKSKLKSFLDTALEGYTFASALKGTGEEADRNPVFYGEFNDAINTIEEVLFSIYNKTRNYVTQKPYSIEKIKLNFQNPTFLDGWDANKEQANLGTLLIKDGHYYLAIFHKDHKKVFETIPKANGDQYQKMVYKYLPGPNKMLPKVFFSEKNIDYYKPSKDLLDAYENGTHKKGAHFNLKDCHRLIDFFKNSIEKHEDWSKFGFKFSDTSTYPDISQFYKEVSQQGYKVSFSDIPVDYINRLVSGGKLYLFELYNKDFSKDSKGKPNLHTLYWKSLFDPKNLQNICMKLNGEAEVFYRPKSLPDTITHPVNQYNKKNILVNKNPINGKKESEFDYPLTKDKRFTEDQFFLHVAISSNFKSDDISDQAFNTKVHDYIRENDDIKIIGIDRGENNLLYVCLIDRDGTIKEQRSLNEIGFGKRNYFNLLSEKEKSRDKARKDWQEIEGIKNLKEGYLSQVIHEITSMMVKHNAIVVLEDLNFGFKRGRQKVERQIYQKFEKMLIEKLNFYVDKNKKIDELGGILQACQLTTKFASFERLGKQTGFLFYMPALYTSVIDPTTGFAPVFKFKYDTIEKSKEIFRKIDSFKFNSIHNRFELMIDFSKLDARYPFQHTLVIEKDVQRHLFNHKFKKDKNEPEIIEIDLFNKTKNLLIENGIEFQSGGNIIPSLIAQSEKGFFERLMYFLSVLTQLRYKNKSKTASKHDEDYILSPVLNKDGECFDSRIISQKEINDLPKDADANGAYHIALKGLWALEQINNSDPDAKKPNLAMTNQQWFEFAARKAKK
jgi:CRISPR-associated protein Cpf1